MPTERGVLLAGIVTAAASFTFAAILHAAFGLNLYLFTFALFMATATVFFYFRWGRP